MELRVLKYFLAVAQTENFTNAAALLHLTQPTLSRQIQELEEEVGTPLLLRGKRKTSLTDAGRLLQSRAREIVELVERTRNSLMDIHTDIRGDVHIACGETKAMRLLARTMKKTREIYPGIRFHLFSGNAVTVSERLDNGLSDFGVFIRPANLEKYEYINFSLEDTWGLLLKRDQPLAEKQYITPEDIEYIPLICSSQQMVYNELAGWFNKNMESLNIVATYTLLYNASILVKEGIGAAICLDGIIDVEKDDEICFRPLKPEIKVSMDVAWKKQHIFSNAAAEFLKMLKKEINY